MSEYLRILTEHAHVEISRSGVITIKTNCANVSNVFFFILGLLWLDQLSQRRNLNILISQQTFENSENKLKKYNICEQIFFKVVKLDLIRAHLFVDVFFEKEIISC